MRISDWSSDVCSSDLSPSTNSSRIWKRRTSAITTVVDLASTVSNSLHSIETGAEAMRGAATTLDGTTLMPASAISSNSAGASMQVKLMASASSSATRLTTNSPVRSEEHTSELQSLMRISYAVLCLKKTKNKKQNQQPHKQ